MPPYDLESDDFTEQVPQVFYNRKDAQSLGLISFAVMVAVPLGVILTMTHATLSSSSMLKVIAFAVILEAVAVLILIFVINAWWRQYRANRPRHRVR